MRPTKQAQNSHKYSSKIKYVIANVDIKIKITGINTFKNIDPKLKRETIIPIIQNNSIAFIIVFLF